MLEVICMSDKKYNTRHVTSISIEADLFLQAKEAKISISDVLNEALRSKLANVPNQKAEKLSLADKLLSEVNEITNNEMKEIELKKMKEMEEKKNIKSKKEYLDAIKSCKIMKNRYSKNILLFNQKDLMIKAQKDKWKEFDKFLTFEEFQRDIDELPSL